ncbi:hypothetical protein [Pseudooceanicola sp.]|uniref:hypothetical protein n=1 Tax=Pseudooceanicola sp. TaxID=1914328 RepID=UPI004059AF6E
MKTAREFGATISDAINEATEGKDHDVIGGAFVILTAGLEDEGFVDYASIAGHLCPATAERMQLALRALADSLDPLVNREPAPVAVKH